MEEERSFIEKARRAQIIAATIEVIATEGYARTSFIRIAKHAKISAGIISYHFTGKAELMYEVIREVYARGDQFMRPRIESQPTATAMLHAYIESNLAFIEQHPNDIHVLMEVGMHFRNEDGTLPYNQQELDQVLLVPEWLFTWGQAQGEFRPFSPRVMAITLRAAIDAVPPRYRSQPDWNMAVYTQELITIFDKATRKEDEHATDNTA